MSEILEPPLPLPAQIARPRIAFSRYHLLLGATLLVLWGVLCRSLSGEWSVNEQYAYGWFVPFFTAYLFWVRWERRPEPQPPQTSRAGLITLAVTVGALLLLLPVRLFEIASPDWRVLGWLHTAIVVALTFLLLWRAGGRSWLRHFAFPILFFFVAVPWILTIEAPVVQGLMRGIAAAVSETLTLFGIPAQVHGAVIHTNNGAVGVNEACSGVRSLQTSLMIALLFGELKRLTAARRIILVFAATAIALLANFARSFFLVWMAATRDLNAVERWHDTAGYSIVIVVLIGCLGLTSLLARGSSRAHEPIVGRRSQALFAPTWWFVTVLCCAVLTEFAVEAWFRWHEAREIPQPRWRVSWPTGEPAYRAIPIDERTKRLLRFNSGAAAEWADSTSDAHRKANELFFFRWNPGTTSVIRARGHRPDVCLPAAGWQQQADYGTRSYRVQDGLTIDLRHSRYISSQNDQTEIVADAFYCVAEDRRPRDARVLDQAEREITDPAHTALSRAILVRAGVRNSGQQVLELIQLARADRPAAEVESEIALFLPRIIKPD